MILELPLIERDIGEEQRAKNPSGKLVCRNVRKKGSESDENAT